MSIWRRNFCRTIKLYWNSKKFHEIRLNFASFLKYGTNFNIICDFTRFTCLISKYKNILLLWCTLLHSGIYLEYKIISLRFHVKNKNNKIYLEKTFMYMWSFIKIFFEKSGTNIILEINGVFENKWKGNFFLENY